MENLGYFGEPFFMENAAKLDDPFADLALYREKCPVYHNRPLNQWFVFRYDDVAALFMDSRLSANRMSGFVDQAPDAVRERLRQLTPSFRSWVMMMDGLDHARTRKFLNLGFNQTVVHELTPAIERSARALLDAVPKDGRFDVAADYGFLLPAYVLSDFLGIRVEHRENILRWSVDFVDFFNIFPITADSSERMIRSAEQMNAYIVNLLEERRNNPRQDFLGILVQAGHGSGGLTSEEIAGNAMLLLLAGHVAVRNLIGNAVYLLLSYPATKQKLDADQDLLTKVIDETLRFEPPVTLIPRIALEDFEVSGQMIPKGAVVQLSIAAANRDPSHFPDPDRFNVTQSRARNLSFGHGPHGCLGTHLARIQSEIALREFFRRFPEPSLDPSRPIQWYRTAANRGPVHLPILNARSN
jgi:cytochrome P450